MQDAPKANSYTRIDQTREMRQAACGTVFHAASGSRSFSGYSAPEGEEAPVLTEREQAILAAIATGMRTSAISEELWVSEHTIKFHLTNIYRKLGVPNRAGAVRYAIENGLAQSRRSSGGL